MKDNDTFGKITAIVTEGLFDFINSLLNNDPSPCRLSDLAKKYSPACDELILKEESSNRLKYVSGYFWIKLVNESQITFSADFYFKDEKESWVAKKIAGTPVDISCLIEPEIAEIRRAKEIKYVIHSPNHKAT